MDMESLLEAASEATPARSRTTHACDRCRRRKVKCSGNRPCITCREKAIPCRFTQETHRISVSVRRLRALESLAQERSHAAGTDPGYGAGGNNVSSHNQGERIPEDECRQAQCRQPGFDRNPLVNRPFVRDGQALHQQQWFLGPSSTWSFSRRVLKHLDNANPQPCDESPPLHLDGAAYATPEADDFSLEKILPSLDHALYLYNAVNFHIGQVFHLLHEETALSNIRCCTDSFSTAARTHPFGAAQYLLILAFGKAFVSTCNATFHTAAKPAVHHPKGWIFASKALSLIPDLHLPGQDNLLATETFGLAALYLQSMDMRVTAFQFAGRALRLCYVTGIQRGCAQDTVAGDLARRCTRLWWSIYILDQHLSAGMGAPSAIQDEDMTAELSLNPNANPHDSGLAIHVHLSKLVANLNRTVYSTSSGVDESFIHAVQSILRGLADVDRLWEDIYADASNNLTKQSRLHTHLKLYYHHCVVLATRPIVMCILTRCLEDRANQGRLRLPSLPTSVMAGLRACTKSALAILTMLLELKQKDLLEMVLPFHLEEAFSSAFVLRIVSATIPDPAYASAHDDSMNILDSMIDGGNMVANLRKTELYHLDTLLHAAFTPYLGHTTPSNSDGPSQEEYEAPTRQYGHPYPSILGVGGMYGDFGLESVVNSSGDLAHLANILNVHDFTSQVIFEDG